MSLDFGFIRVDTLLILMRAYQFSENAKVLNSSTYSHPIWLLGAPSQTIYSKTAAGMTRPAFTYLVTPLSTSTSQ